MASCGPNPATLLAQTEAWYVVFTPGVAVMASTSLPLAKKALTLLAHEVVEEAGVDTVPVTGVAVLMKPAGATACTLKE